MICERVLEYESKAIMEVRPLLKVCLGETSDSVVGPEFKVVLCRWIRAPACPIASSLRDGDGTGDLLAARVDFTSVWRPGSTILPS